ncbi:MAG: DUF192 domain-containing protein [Solirubrobacterales bacterium]|nr:DUF192 domain-containing protein [Solirubrobacterales bacterium]
MEIRDADTPLLRLRGLLGHRRPPGYALRLAPCGCVHTFGLPFSLELRWFDANGKLLRVDGHVPPWRVRWCRGARSVVEVPLPR